MNFGSICTKFYNAVFCFFVVGKIAQNSILNNIAQI